MKRFLIFCVLLCTAALTAATVHPIDNFRNPDGTPLVVPRPHKYEARPGVFALPETLTVEASEAIVSEYLDSELGRFSRKTVKADAAAQCRFVIAEDGVPDNSEGYTLEISEKGITVKSRTDAGLFYGAVTLCSLIRNAARPELDCCFITDWPTVPYRCYTLRISNVPSSKLEQLKNLIDTMAKFKFNCVFLEVAEAFPYENVKFAKSRIVHSREVLADFRDYCRARHVSIVPCLQVLSHNYWMTFHADWDKMKEGTPNRPWDNQPCIQNEEARAITMNCLREQIAFFNPEIVDVYMDEIVYCPFRKCPRCRNVPTMTLLTDYMKFLREGLKDFKGRLFFSNDSFYSGRHHNWPGAEFRKLLNPERDLIGYWDYSSNPNESGIAPFRDFTTFGTCITGRPLNAQKITETILKYKGEGVRLTHWYYSRGGSFTNFKTETPESLGGFPQGAEYLWHCRDEYFGDFTYDGVYEMLRVLRPEMAKKIPAREEGTPLPIERSVNAELSGSGLYPVLDDASTAEMKKLLAARPEHFKLLTAPGGRYYAMRISGDRSDRGREGIRFNAFGRKFKTLSLLMTASRPYNLRDYLAGGKKLFKTEPGAMLCFAYTDGKTHLVPLRYRADFTDWNSSQGGVNMRFAVRGVDARDLYYGFGVCDIANPRPDVPVKNITFFVKYLDGISPAILAVSLKSADRPIDQVATFDPTKIAKPYAAAAVTGPKFKIHYDFKHGMPEDLRIVPQGKLSGELDSRIVDDPERGKVLKITVPAGGEEHTDGYIRVNISMPFKYDKALKGTFVRVRLVAAPGDFWQMREYLHTRKITDPLTSSGKYSSCGFKSVGSKWTEICWSYDRRPSEYFLKDFGKANTRRICFYFGRLTVPAEIYVDEIGEKLDNRDAVPERAPGREGY